MRFYVNELSLHGQFADVTALLDAIRALMEINGQIAQFGFRCFCGTKFSHRPAIANNTLCEVVRGLSNQATRAAILAWVNKNGPFWEKEEPRHTSDDYFTCDHIGQGEIVTEYSLAEAACCKGTGTYSVTVSMAPSKFTFDPIEVSWVRNAGTVKIVVQNLWEQAATARLLEECERPLASWNELEGWAARRCANLVFGPDTFTPLHGVPFGPNVRDIQDLLLVLSELNSEYRPDGAWTDRGTELINLYFVGELAKFTDESDEDKAAFRNQLTFRKPNGNEVFCPFHGKIKSRQFRIHFNWPKRRDEELFIAYVGPKITKH